MILQKQCYPPENLVIERNAYCEMEQAVRDAYPDEACGVLLGNSRTGRVNQISGMKNRAGKDASGRYYRIDPLEIYRLECQIESEGYEVIGFYHSHADAEAILSDEDEENMIPGMLYTIFPVFDGKPGQARAYGKTGPGRITKRISIKLEETAQR